MSVEQEHGLAWGCHSVFLYSDAYLADLSGKEPPAMHPRFEEMYRYLERVMPEGACPAVSTSTP